MGQATPARSRAAIEKTVREHSGYILASLTGYVRDLDLAEDVLQDAAVAALRHGPKSGIPDNPRAWLLQTARRKAIDRFRRDARFRERREELGRRLVVDQLRHDDGESAAVVDERLALIFTCCHPALAEPARVALTLRTLGGLTTEEIARAFLVPEATMAQRLVRAKRKIRTAGIPYRVPPPELWPERLDSALAVLYLIFNEGYSATSADELVRPDLCAEAIRLGHTLVEIAPEEPEVMGLLALMLLHDSRRAARVDARGDYVALQDQDRSSWDREQIKVGIELLRGALARGRPGPFQLQAAISAVHAGAPSHEETDWREITGLYRKLYALRPSPVVKLNEAVALSFAESAEEGLRALQALARSGELRRYQPFHAARADLLRRAGRRAEAAAAYRTAIELTGNAVEKRFLEERLARMRPTEP